MEAPNRKLIRPSFQDAKEKITERKAPPKKTSPSDSTNAENFYYVKQMQLKTPMVVVLKDGEALHGMIEWYDKHCLKIHRGEGPNVLLYKANIKYMYKDE